MTNMAKIANDKGIIRQAGTEVQKGIISRERREMKERVGEVELLYKIILPYAANTEHLQQPTPHVITPKVDVVTDVILTEYFSTEAIKNYLFPEGRMLVNTVPYRLMRENIPLIMDKSGFTEILSDVVLGNNKCTGLLTVGTIYPVKRPKFAYNIEIYGDCVISLDAHIACHLERIANKAYGRVSIHVVVGDKVSRTQVDKVMLQYGVVADKVRNSDQGEPVIKRTLYEMVHQNSRM